MKKLLRNIALLLLPVMAYFCLFVCFERNNYFGLRSSTPSGEPLGMLRAYEAQPQTSLIVGDSRFAHFDLELVQQAAGRPFGNIAFGGASLKECLDLLDWWMEKYPDIDEVVFGLSWYTVNAAYRSDRVEAIQQSLYNPLVYMTNLSFNLEMLQTAGWYFFEGLRGDELYGGAAETEAPSAYVYEQYTTPGGQQVQLRSRIADYISRVQPMAEQWALAGEDAARLVQTAAELTGRGVRFIVVLPPMHPAILEYVCEPQGIEEQMMPLLDALRQTGADVLDYEFTGRPDFAEDMFFDGFHLDAQRGLPVWTEMLFSDINAL